MSRLKEQRSWDAFKTAVDTATLKLIRVENLASDSVPDVIGQNLKGTVFWIENKALNCWPMRANTAPLANAFEPGQMPFLRNWRQWNGQAFVLLRVGTMHYLLDPLYRDGDLRELNRDALMSSCKATGKMNIVRYLEGL